MKILAFILSVYILALNFVPCEDTVSFDDDITMELSQDLDHNHSDSNSDVDLCSPFCQCNCCQIHATSFDLSDIADIKSDISTELCLHFDSLGKDIPKSILQPPQV